MRGARRVAGFVLLLLLLLVPGGRATGQGGGLAEPLYPRPRYPLPFSHLAHQQEPAAGSCPCHPGAATSEAAADLLLPTPGSCPGCHPAWSQLVDEAVPLLAAPARVHFSHRRHAAAGLACPACHPPATGSGSLLPAMATCLVCHEAAGRPVSCPDCHLTAAAGLLRTRFFGRGLEFGPLPRPPLGLQVLPGPPEDVLRPDDALPGLQHDGGWRQRHGAVAATGAARCESCHLRESCRDCHQGRLLPLTEHPAGWDAEHARAARVGEVRCQSCHRLATFCVGCHRRTGVVAGGEPSSHPLAAAVRFHPAGWAALVAPGASHHGAEARRSLATCVGCHQEQTCLRCHRSRERGGFGVAIHGTVVGERCQQLLAANPRGCLRCHDAELRHDPRCR